MYEVTSFRKLSRSLEPFPGSQINFSQFAEDFVRSRMDGDLLLRMTEEMLKNDIGMANGILRNRFMRELNSLKKMADYASCDSTGLNAFLQSISPEFSVYTYPMLTSGVDKDCLRWVVAAPSM